MKISQVFLLLLAGTLSFTACKKDDDKEDEEVVEFDRSALLANIGDNIIYPQYQAYQQEVNFLKTAATNFSTSPDQANLNALRITWEAALMRWQHVAMFEFGPAEQVALTGSSNIFPVDTSLIQSNITSGSYNLGAASNIDAKGLQALDYLLFGLANDDNAILDLYTTAGDAANRMTYLNDVVDDLVSNIAFVVNAWSPGGGNYLGTFKGDPSTSAGSPLSLFLNAFVQTYERDCRAGKLGIPVGALTFSQTPLPDRVEAYYQNSKSHQYLLESLDAYRRVYRGIGVNDSEGLGLDDYVKHTEVTNNGTPLDDAIVVQLSAAISAINQLPTPLSQTVQSNQADALAAYGKLQQMVVLWKVDMMSAFGVLITFVDNDGD